MNLLKKLLLSLSLVAVASHAAAQTKIEDAWVRATVPGQASSGAFMTLTASTDSQLLSVQSPVAKVVQIHQSSMKDDVMSMQQVDSVALPAGKPVTLDSNGYHIMLIDLAAQVKEGDHVPLTLIVEDAQGAKSAIKVDAIARALNLPDHHAMPDHGTMKMN